MEDLPHIKVAANDYYDDYWKVFWQRLYDKHEVPSLIPEAYSTART